MRPAMTDLKTIDDLDEELSFLQAKLNLIDQKKAALLEAEGSIRVEMQHVQNQISRARQLKT